ncbi:hypothetical protein TIFTF001_004639 [Ficus carica]|uniref:Adenylyl-sulfate kinase n=1 Tax=Ficus carica TaxID=3494 RepID=A0AA87ZCC3_FICCA|nr:hypothetical protein TIFTF001_004639 [Ficus carica]
MAALKSSPPSMRASSPEFESPPLILPSPGKLAFVNVRGDNAVRLERWRRRRRFGLFCGPAVNLRFSPSIKSVNDYASVSVAVNDKNVLVCVCNFDANDALVIHFGMSGKNVHQLYAIGKSTNITWHKSSVEKLDRQELLKQKGCAIWITGLSGSGKSTLACALSRGLHSRGKLSYVLDGDNIRHGLNSDLSFQAEDRAENIRRIGEVAKLFADSGIICIASLISPYRIDRDACRSLLPEGDFIEVYLDVPLEVCESRDPKGLYKLARAGKIKGFTGIDDPYEPPLKCEIVLQQKGKDVLPLCEMVETVISYLEEKGFLQA